MSASGEPQPGGYDPSAPSIARMYDYFLGGKDNFAADREAAALVLEHAPDVPLIARESRRFLRRVVRFLVDAGIRQFVDIGTGLPTQGHIHEILEEIAPGCTVAYVDNDPVVATHARALLTGNGSAIAIQADLRDPETIFSDPLLNQMIDMKQPVAVLLMSVLHFIGDDAEATRIVGLLRETVVPGSYLALSHAVSDVHAETVSKLSAIYREGPMKHAKQDSLPTTEQVGRFLDGLEPVPPGVVPVTAWHPDLGDAECDARVDAAGGDSGPVRLTGPAPAPEAVWMVGGVGRKR